MFSPRGVACSLEEWSLDGGFEKHSVNNALELYNLNTDVSVSDNLAS